MYISKSMKPCKTFSKIIIYLNYIHRKTTANEMVSELLKQFKATGRRVQNIIITHTDTDHYNLIPALFPSGAPNIILGREIGKTSKNQDDLGTFTKWIGR